MKYMLKNNDYSFKQLDILTKILKNRNIQEKDMQRYLNTTDEDINSPLLLGEDKLRAATELLIQNIKDTNKVLVICDCDADGFTSAGLLLNYLYDLFPAFVENCVKWYVHSDKQHGMADVMDYINQKDFSLIICPDSATNDMIYQKELKEKGIDTIVLDHHLSEGDIYDKAIIINNQICDYPNKELSGVGVVWQFCRYIDNLMGKDYAEAYLDLVALGLTGDMMSLIEIETKHLINKGFESSRIKNPYIYEMWQKNKFKLGEQISSIDAAFYIVPMINAVQRSGTIEEKELLFKSMLKYEAFKMIPSTKRGCKGEEERLVDQAVRMSTNVKNRQTRAQEASLEYLENKIEEENLLDNKVLVFTLEPGKVDKNIAGLIANKMAGKYQRPCCMLTKIEVDGEPRYQGSARGYQGSGLEDFKSICEGTGLTLLVAGHHNAFGLAIGENAPDEFIKRTNEQLKDFSTESVYVVDEIYKGGDVVPADIIQVSELKHLWGKDFNEALVAIEGLKVTPSMVTVYRKTSNTLKITLPNKVSIMKFNASEEECDMFQNQQGAYIEINVVGRCSKNEWMGNISAQVMLEEYEVVGVGAYIL